MAQILDLGKIRFQFKGEWSASTEYQFNDVVSYKGNAYVYISTAKTTNTLTSNTQFWGRMSNGFDFTGAWAVGTTYGYGSVVRYGGDLFVYTNSVASAGNLPTNATYWTLYMFGWNFTGTWSSATAYKIGEIATYGGIAYVAVQDSTNQNPENNATYWSTVVQGVQAEGTYSGATTYQKNDIVMYGNTAYVATQTTTGNLPTNATYWSVLANGTSFKGTYSAGTAYNKGDIVLYGNSSYTAKSDTTGNTPTNATYWDAHTYGVSWKGTYAGGTAYNKGDMVFFGGYNYIAKLDTTGNAPTNATYWDVVSPNYSNQGAYVGATTYYPGHLVTYSNAVYVCILTSTGNLPTNTTYWAVFVPSPASMARTAISSATTLTPNTRYIADTSAGLFTVTMPSSPADGDTIQIADAKGTFTRSPLIINPNGKSIASSTGLFVHNVANYELTLKYTAATSNWSL